MEGAQPVDELADGRREPFVGGLGVGPQRVAPGLGDHDGVEHRAERRGLHEGDVGVPLLAVVVLAAKPPAESAAEGAGLGVVDLEDLAVLLEPGDDGVGHGDLAEGGGEVLVLFGVRCWPGKKITL